MIRFYSTKSVLLCTGSNRLYLDALDDRDAQDVQEALEMDAHDGHDGKGVPLGADLDVGLGALEPLGVCQGGPHHYCAAQDDSDGLGEWDSQSVLDYVDGGEKVDPSAMENARAEPFQKAMALEMETVAVAPLGMEFEGEALERTVAKGSPYCLPVIIRYMIRRVIHLNPKGKKV